MTRLEPQRSFLHRGSCWVLIATLALGPFAEAPASPRSAAPSRRPGAADPVAASPTSAPDTASRAVSRGLENLPLYFIANEGQVDGRVAYYVHGATTSVYLTQQAIVFALTSANDGGGDGWAVRLEFEGASPDVRIRGRERTDAVVSYFKGRPSAWKTGLATYASVVYEDLWPGIDLVYGSEGGRPKYTFVVEAGADPRQIRLAYRGASAVRMTESGQLSIVTPAGSFEEQPPSSWQETPAGRREVASAFEPVVGSGEGYRFGFRLGPYDPTQPLVIDPVVLSYCGFLGGTAGGNGDEGFGIAVDATGAAYVVGSTTSADFPVTGGAFDTTQAGNRDAFVAKVNAAGTGLVYATFIGGTLDDIARGVAVDGSGAAYVTGETASSEGVGFPVLLGPDLTYAGNTDGFVLKLNAAGSALAYSGFIGGSGTDRARAIAVDAAGAAYVGGTTTSDAATFPETAGAFDLVLNNQDGFVAKLTVAGGAFTYCTYLGSGGSETLQGIAVDAAGSAYVTGYTDNSLAPVFPTTGGAYDTTANGGNDAFVTKFNAAGSALVYSTLLGGTALDNPIAIALDAAGNAYVAGQTTSSDFPRTSLQTWSGGNDGFVTKLNTTGTALVYSGFVGGTGFDAITGIDVDNAGSAWLAGNTDSTEAQGFPVAGSLDLTYNGGFSDAFAAQVNAAGTALVFCTYIGGSGDEQSGAIAVDSGGGAYLTGTTTSTEATFPETVGPDLTQNGPGSNDAFVAKIASITPIYYSVGTNAAALYSGNASAASGTLTLASAAADNVGIGDEIREGSNRYYITGRTSPTVFSIQNSSANGGTPGATNITFASTPITIFRAFNLLSTAEANSSDASHLNTANLVAASFQLNWACYNDGVMANSTRILGYTTGPSNYIRVFTPTAANEVGVSQRHSGVFGTGFQLSPPANAHGIQATDNYVRIEGLVIQLTVTNNSLWAGVWADNAGAADVRVSHNVIKGVITGGVTGGPAGVEVGTAGGGQVYRIWNNVVYNFTASGVGISADNGIVYVFNNTVFNSATGIYKTSNVTGEVRNNVSINDALNAAFVDYFQLAGPPAATRSGNVSSDATSETVALQSKTAYASYFKNTTPGSEDLHIRTSSQVLWTANGTDLSAHANQPVTNDIDGDARVRPDIGADEFNATEAYYSVGTAAGPLYSANASATNGTLTLASAAPANVGVGDEVRVGATAPRYYITGRVSATVFTIQDSAAAGGTPGATNISFASTAITIRRAFNLLSTAEANSSDASHLNTADLVTAGFQLNWPCYNDAPMDNRVDIGGYTTSAVNYIKVYTPVYANQVGGSQRHTGRARTGFRLRPTSALDNDTIVVSDRFVRIEGIEIDGSLSAAPNGAGGVSLQTFATTPVEHHVSHNIIYDTRNFTGIYAASMLAKVWNNVLHNVDNTALGAMTMSQGGGTGYFYNNTVYDHAGHGIRRTAGTMIATNNVSMLPGGGFQDFNGAPTQSYNVSSDLTAAGAGSQTSMAAYAIYFQNTTAGAEDLHLRGTSLGLWGSNGTNLAGDPNLAVSNDIDSEARVRPDIGADEFAPKQLFRSVGPLVTPLASGGGNALTISGSTATFGAALPNNVGVGDAIQYDSDGNGSIDAVAFVHARTSSQVYTVKSAAGATPTAVAGDNDWALYRAYTTLANWESQSENANINATVRNFDTSTDLVTAGAVMNVACYADGPDGTAVTINGWTTSPETYINIFTPVLLGHVGTSQRHNGAWDSTKYRLVGSRDFFGFLLIQDDYVRVTGLQIENSGSLTNRAAGIEVHPATAAAEVRLSHNILRATGPGTGDWWAAGIAHRSNSGPGGVLKAWNNIMYDWGAGIFLEYSTDSTGVLYNNTIVNPDQVGIEIDNHAAGSYRLANNLVQGTPSNGNYYFLVGVTLAYSQANLSQDATSPDGAAFRNKAVTFVGAPNYHLSAADISAKDQGTNLSADPVLAVYDDIDGQLRAAPWDIGADDASGTTAVKLMSFEAVAEDAAVGLLWRTASELDNLGFHLYRGLSAGGPWTRLTASLVPGLGSSAVGRAYSFRDSGLVNGNRYFYRLEDVDASSKVTSHGPVSAVPMAGLASNEPESESPGSSRKKQGTAASSCPDWVLAAYGSTGGASSSALRCTRHGDPEAVSLGVAFRDSRQATLELRTGGFYALHEGPGKVRVFVPGFDSPQDPEAPALPFRRALVDAVVGRRAELGGVRALEQVAFRGLVPASLGKAEMQVSQDGTVRVGRRALRDSAPRHVSLDLARLLPSVFQGETKSAVVELSPLRYDARRRQIVLAKRLLVKLLFTGRETGESGRGSFGRRARPQKPIDGELLARLHTTGRGLYAVSFEQLFPGRSAGLASAQLRLERQGQAQAFHVAPASDTFGPGSVLYFHADATAASTDFSSETAWELRRAVDGVRMPLVSARPEGAEVASAATGQGSFEMNRFYQPGLLEAKDPWLWEAVATGATRATSFSLAGVEATAPQAAELEVFLQGASESGGAIDHHVSVSLNGAPVGEAQFAGKTPYRISLSVPPSLLRDGANELSLTNVADTGVSSMVFLDRFTVSYPQSPSLAGGRWEGEWPEGGTVSVTTGSAVSGPVRVVDVTGGTAGPAWLTGFESTNGAVRFSVEAGHRYWVGTDSALFRPRVSQPQPSTLKSALNQADYVLIAPRAFLTAAEPLLQRRRDQGLATRAVAFEEIADEFGHGQPSAEAMRAFLAFAFQSWARPSPRYVLLLGDASYDPRNFTGASQPSPLPALWAKTSYLWTASDPLLAAVNGEDALPDLAIGRLPAATVEQAEALVAKLLAWEDAGAGLAGGAALVADNPDIAGDFEADVRDIAKSYLAGRSELLLLRELGAQTRPRILEALDSGLSYLSYVGHGGAAVWASENVWNTWDAPSLQAQSRQPLLVTMNCLNGYFVAPAYDSLAESLIKAEGRGAIAAFSPSGLSLDGPAHLYHRALMAELTGGRHQRLGDAVLAAQTAYAQAGVMPELLSVYHLLGDPAMPIR